MPRSWVYSINSCPSTSWQVSNIGMIGLRIQAARWNRIAWIYFYFHLASDGWPWSEWSQSNSSTKIYAGILSVPYVTRHRYLGFHFFGKLCHLNFILHEAYCDQWVGEEYKHLVYFARRGDEVLFESLILGHPLDEHYLFVGWKDGIRCCPALFHCYFLSCYFLSLPLIWKGQFNFVYSTTQQEHHQ